MEDQFKVTCHTYRTARVIDNGSRVQLPRALLRTLERELAKLSGQPWPDNHVVYQVEVKFEETVYLWFHDSEVYIGPTIDMVELYRASSWTRK